MTLLHPAPTDARAMLIERLFRLVQHVPGNVVECGVRAGNSLGYLTYLAKTSGRDIWGFDSWLPGDAEKAPLLDIEQAHPTTPSYADALDSITNALSKWGFGISDVTLVRGWFVDTLHATDTGPLAFIHIDSDIYSSYMDALGALWPRLSPGGIVLFDEYQSEDKWRGARIAVDEFLADKSHVLIEDVRWYALKREEA